MSYNVNNLNKMKICFIANAGAIHIQRLVKYFADKGHEVHLISDEIDHIEGAINHKLIINTKGKINFILRAITGPVLTRRFINEIKPDVVHAQQLTNNGFYASLSGFHPLVVSAVGSDILVKPKKIKIFRYLIKYILSKSDVIHSMSNNITEELISVGAKQKKVVTFPRGIDMQKFNPDVRGDEIKKDLHLENNFVVISTRYFKPVYNIEFLIKAVPNVIKKDNKVRFILAGEGKQEGYLKKLTDELKIRKYIRFVGGLNHDEIPKYLAASDVYVSTSLSDGAPNSLFEAMACGAFPVVTDIPANRPWIDDEKNGFLVPFDHKILAQKILETIQSNELIENAKNINWNIVKKSCDSDTNLGKIEKIYYELIKKYKNKS